MPTYQYTGDATVVFINVQNPDGSTWTASNGDQITVDYELSHPCLELVSAEKTITKTIEVAKSPETVDESQEN